MKRSIKLSKASSQANQEKEATQIIITEIKDRHHYRESMDIKRIIKEPQEQFYGHKFDNLDEINQFLKRHNLPNSYKKQAI